MKNTFKLLLFTLTLGTSIISCHDDLDQFPIDPDSFTEQDVFADIDEAKSALAKLYSSLAVTGQQGGDSGQPDISDIDQGFSQFTRMLFNLNELTTDHAVVGWGDPGLPDLHGMYWTSSNDFSGAMYLRLAQEVSFCNSFIQNVSELSEPEAEIFIAEARFLRAYAYYNLMDLYGRVPILETISTELPFQSSRAEVFTFVEGELLDIQDKLPEKQGEYGRVDRVAAWALLSRLYLNAEVYTSTDTSPGQTQWGKCVEYSEKVINSSYSLHTTDLNGNGTAYDELFLADNDKNGAQNEFIFPILFDGVSTRTYGGSTFLIHGALGGSMNPVEFGVNGGWGGYRTTKTFVNRFEDGDSRAMFYTDGQSLEIESIPPFNQGYAVTKFRNVDVNGNQGKDDSGEFTDTDLAMIRLPEIYLNYAEAVVKSTPRVGELSLAVSLINRIRERAFGDTSGNITEGELTETFILNERSRELYWEGLRRTDLIRHDLFTTSQFLWPWKGNQRNGTGVQDFRRIFPIPSNTILTNPNLEQNRGY